jgi:hypothetical protein
VIVQMSWEQILPLFNRQVSKLTKWPHIITGSPSLYDKTQNYPFSCKMPNQTGGAGGQRGVAFRG